MSVALGLPAGFLPKPEISVSNGTRSELVVSQPNNVSSVAGTSSQTAILTTSGVSNLPFTSQLLQFSIPCGQGRRVWLDTAKSTLSFRIKYNISAVEGTWTTSDMTAYVKASAYSWFNRITHVNAQGQILDDVVNTHVTEIVNDLLEVNISDRDGFAQVGYLSDKGANQNLVQGHAITNFTVSNAAPSTTVPSYYNYELPLHSSLLGKYAKGAFIPIGSVAKLDLQMYTNNEAPISLVVATAPSAGKITCDFVMDNIRLNLTYVTLDDESMKLVGAPAMHYTHGITQRVATGSLAASALGYQNILIGLRAKSVRQLFTRFSDSAGHTWADSKMPIASQMNYLLNGTNRYPKVPHSTQYFPMSVLNRCLQASERFSQWHLASSLIPTQYCKYIPTGTGLPSQEDQFVVDSGSGYIGNNLSTFLFGEDLRVCSSSEVLDGVDMTTSANHFLELNLLCAPSATTNVYFVGRMDIIYEWDLNAGTVVYRM